MSILFKDDQFDFQVLRLLGETAYCAADIGEVISTSNRITEGDYDSWCDEWTKTAERLHSIGNKAFGDGHLISARKAYLRASNYYRTAEFFLHENPNPQKIEELFNVSTECFSKVMELNNPVIKSVMVPYEGTTLPAHYYQLNDTNEPKPVMILLTGFDGTKEEFYGLAMTALEHGMNCLAIEGPGQGEAVKKQHLYFRADYEAIVTPAVDYLLANESIDPEKIVLWGESFGGYLAPRAAAFEYRLAACIANSGIYDFLGGGIKGLGLTREQILTIAEKDSETLNKKLYDVTKKNPEFRWKISQGMYVFGCSTPSEFVIAAGKYLMKGIAENIKCPTLVIDTDEDGLVDSQAKPLYDVLTCRKDYMLFIGKEGAGAHCQCGAKLIGNERIFSWIEDILSGK
ncbi:alpha/beta hydrolase family protein [Clostridium akagii]|uniref:alpha/beta hydrolase family protein n=1 Tax=Clostridium akagii TaxID=91623 RepID=UPI00047DCEA5|nr:prolyl oligopeptidase family serine peptidase [Clostridium akagii]